MKKIMKFNSQICTTKEQSERLLALGLKRETADCRICPLIVNPNQYLIMDMGIQPLDEDETPAWSLHRLIEMLPQVIEFGEKWVFYPLRVMPTVGGGWAISYCKEYDERNNELIDALYDMIVKLKEKGL
jgi:hypothetical protein